MDGVEQTARIHILPDSLANQIAAGEVIERPASVVKELLENSLDAGATRIDLTVENGGIRLIRVQDNGVGIHPDDLALALQSHATSKLHKPADLFRITSLGFRGEALSSIASVSRFRLTSRLRDLEQAWSISIAANSGRTACLPAAHPPGTSVEVAELFHNVPARRKFLRMQRTEFQHILEVVRRLALSSYETEFVLSHNGRNMFSCRDAGQDRQLRISSVMGKTFIRQALQLDYQTDDMHLSGWLGSAGLSRSQSDRQYFYLNGRMVRDKRVNHAIRLAYADDIPMGRYPCYVLYLDMDPAVVDVNVHPSKYEVRFQHTRNVHDFIYAGVCRDLSADRQRFPDIRETGSTYRQVPATDDASHGIQLPERADSRTTSVNRSATGAGKPAFAHTPDPATGRSIAQLQGRYILVERDNGVLLLDVQSAWRLVIRQRMAQGIAGDTVRSRPLLVPVTMKISEQQGDSLEQHQSLLAACGLTLQRASPAAIMVRSIPVILPDADIQSLLKDILNIISSRRQHEDKLQQDLINAMAEQGCRSASGLLGQADILDLFRALDQAGLNIRDKRYPGVWRMLQAAELQALLKDE